MVVSKWRPYFILALLGSICFLPNLGYNHLFDWDEINFAESAREMIVTGDYLRVRINYQPFWEKPPLFFWLQAVSMQIFGINEMAARFPNALCSVWTMWALYWIGSREKNSLFGWIWALLYAGMLLPQVYHRSGIIDPVFNILIFFSIYHLYLSSSCNHYKNSHVFSAGLFAGLAVLTKGPVGLLLVVITYLMICIRSRSFRRLTVKQLLLFAASAFVISSLWYGVETIKNGPEFLLEFISYQWELFRNPVAGHGQPWYYHPIVLLLGCFPISIFILPDLARMPQEGFGRWIWVLFWVVLVLFSLVTTKIVHYSSMAYIPIAYFGAQRLYRLYRARGKVAHWQLVGFALLGLLWSILLIAIPYLLHNKSQWMEYLNDPYLISVFKLDVHVPSSSYLPGFVFLVFTALSVVLMIRKAYFKMVLIHLLLISLMMGLFARFTLPIIESYSQGALVEFFDQYADEDVYMATIGFKSYIPYYYGQVMLQNSYGYNKKELLNEPLDRPLYFSVKIGKEPTIEEGSGVEFLYEKGGFLFFRKNSKP